GKPSYLGEVYYLESDRPEGPWTTAVKVVTHDHYTFYNPVHHPFLDRDRGRIIYFEGTYANTFSGNPDQTPRYDYNQILYRLDLADARLVLPVPVYRLANERLGTRKPRERIAFFALDRPRDGAVPIYADSADGRLRVGGQDD